MTGSRHQRMSQRPHPRASSGSSRPPGNTSRSIRSLARSNASSGRSASAQPRQTPQQLADVGRTVAGAASSTKPTSCLPTSQLLQTMQNRACFVSRLSQRLAVCCNSGAPVRRTSSGAIRNVSNVRARLKSCRSARRVCLFTVMLPRRGPWCRWLRWRRASSCHRLRHRRLIQVGEQPFEPFRRADLCPAAGTGTIRAGIDLLRRNERQVAPVTALGFFETFADRASCR